MTTTLHFRPPRTGAVHQVNAHFTANASLYSRWSPDGHLHFGLWRWPLSLFRRRPMLEELVRTVATELRPRRGAHLADLGCGYGTAARMIARASGTRITAVTVVEQQAREAMRAVVDEGLEELVEVRHRDFRDTGLAAHSVNGVFALESLCYDRGMGKRRVLAEAARILRPGGRLALVDGFLLKRPRGPRAALVRTVEEGWALPCFPHREAFMDALERAGFVDIRLHDLSWRVVPCAAHGPLLMLQGWLERRWRGTRLEPLERAHLRICLWGILLGTQRDLFRYLMITATKA